MAKSKGKSKVITKEQFAKWSPAHQARALADKRIRQRIETSALPAEYKAKRLTAQRMKEEISPGSGVTYGDVEKSRKYTETLTFGEGDRQLADRFQTLADARKRDEDWFTKYRAAVSAAQDKSIAAQGMAAQGNQQMIDSANQVSAQSRDAIMGQLRDRAAQLGQADQSAEYRGLADAAAAARASGMANTASRQIADANTGVNVATGNVGTAALKDLEARGYRDKQASALEKDTRDYVEKRGAWRQKFLEDSIAAARKAVLEDKAFGLKQAELGLKTKQAEADNKIAQARIDIARGNLDVAAARLGLSRRELDAKIAAGYFNKAGKKKYDGSPWKNPDPQKRFDHGLSWLKSQTVAGGKLTLTPDRVRRGGTYGGATFWINKLQSQGLSPTLAHRVLYSFLHNYSGSYKKAPKRYEG